MQTKVLVPLSPDSFTLHSPINYAVRVKVHIKTLSKTFQL